MSKPDVAIILLNYNRYDLTIECIRSLLQCNYPSYCIMVFDNASKNDSVQKIRSEFPQIEVLQTGTNLGYTGGVNFGIRHALKEAPSYILILNEDTLVEPDFLDHLVEALEGNPSAAAACGTIYYHPETTKVWYAGGRMIPWRGLAVHSKKIPSNSDVQKVSFITGCMILLRKSIIEKVGMEDERFFVYLDDIELSARLVAAGYDLLYVPKAVIYHKVWGEGESTFKLYYSVRNRLLLINSSFKMHQRLISSCYFIIVIVSKLFLWRLTNPRFFKAAWYGIVDFFSKRFYQGRGVSEFSAG